MLVKRARSMPHVDILVLIEPPNWVAVVAQSAKQARPNMRGIAAPGDW